MQFGSCEVWERRELHIGKDLINCCILLEISVMGDERHQGAKVHAILLLLDYK